MDGEAFTLIGWTAALRRWPGHRQGRVDNGHSSVGAFLFGAIVPTFVFCFVVLPLKGLAIGSGATPSGFTVAFVVDRSGVHHGAVPADEAERPLRPPSASVYRASAGSSQNLRTARSSVGMPR
jgi:hypothetical protein